MNTDKHERTLTVTLWVVLAVSMLAAAIGVFADVFGLEGLSGERPPLALIGLAAVMLAGVAAVQLIGFLGAERTARAFRARRWAAAAIGAVMFCAIIACNAWWSHKGWTVLLTLGDAAAHTERRDPALVAQELARAEERLAQLDALSPELLKTADGVAAVQATLAFVGVDPKGVDGAAGGGTTEALAGAIVSLERAVFTLSAEQRGAEHAAAAERQRRVLLWGLVAVFESLGAFGRFWLLGAGRGGAPTEPARADNVIAFRTPAAKARPVTYAPDPQNGGAPFLAPAGQHWVFRHNAWHLRRNRGPLRRRAMTEAASAERAEARRVAQ